VNSEIAFNAVEAMMEQDAVLNQQKQSSPKVLMSIETYQYLQENPEKGEEIYNRMIQTSTDPLAEVNAFLKKW
jgi:hypothetical protein